MTANNEHLDRAIEVAQERVFNNQERIVDPLDRTYACALIASVWEQIAMARKPYSKTKGADYNAGVAVGFEAALLELRKFSTVESEG